MTDATQGHSHAHDHPVDHSRSHGHALPAPARASLLELSASGRLLGVSILVAGLWAAVYWAVH